ncbi:hypothetical protein GCM10022237_34110 [Nocardioides ginsengisoli]
MLDELLDELLDDEDDALDALDEDEESDELDEDEAAGEDAVLLERLSVL